MRSIVILGLGGFAREVHTWLHDVMDTDESLVFKGFCGPQPPEDRFEVLCRHYLGPDDGGGIAADDLLIAAIGEPSIRAAVFAQQRSQGRRFFNLIHPSARLDPGLVLGEGNIFCPACIVTSNVRIGDGNVLNMCTTVGHDVTLGDYNTMSCQCDLTGGCRLGDGNLLGSRVSVLPGAQVGNRCRIAAGSVVYRGLRDEVVALGNPARIVGGIGESVAVDACQPAGSR